MAATATPSVLPGDLEPPHTDDREPRADWVERFVGDIERNSVWVLAGLMLISGALLLFMGRGLSFYYDEWEWLIHDSAGGTHWLLVAHVGNISVFPALIYRVLFHLVGFNHYAIFRLDVILLHLICGLLVYVLAARRIPRLPALVAAAFILFLGAAWEDLLWGFQIGYLLSVAGGLATWVLLEEERRFSDLAAMLCLVVAAGSSSLGIAIMVGVAAELARQRSRLWIVVIPVLLYALWYLGYGVSQVTEGSLIHAPGYAEELAAAAFGGLVGRGLEWGRPLALVGLLFVLGHLFRQTRISARLIGLLGAGVALWVVTAVARSTTSPPESSRYIYLGAVVIVLTGVELLRGVRITARASAIAALIVVFCGLSGLKLLHEGGVGRRAISSRVTAELGALELAARYTPARYQPDPLYAPPVYAGEYLQAVRRIGSTPADTPAGILSAEPSDRSMADSVLLALESPKQVVITGKSVPASKAAPRILNPTGNEQLHGGCVTLAPVRSSAATAIVVIPSGRILIDNPGSDRVALSLKRFGEGFLALPDSLAAKTDVALSIPTDSSSVAWQLQMASKSGFTVCGASG